MLAAAEDDEGGDEDEDEDEEMGVGVGVDVGVAVEELAAMTAAFCAGADGPGVALVEESLLPELPPLLEPLPALLALPSNTSKFAFTPFGTVTTQKAAPPAPSVLAPIIWLT